MKITVLGAGAIGASVARDLARTPEVTTVQVVDARARPLQELQDTLPGLKLRSFQADARDAFVLRSILAGSDVVVGSVPFEINPALAELCVSLGIHYLDLGGSDAVVERQLALDAEAKARGVWVVPNCGLGPGLVNVLCLHAIEAFDEVDAAQIRLGGIPQDPTPPFNFCASWSPDKIIEDYTNPVEVIEDGQIAFHEPLTHLETLHFDEPYADLEAFCAQGGLATLARSVAHKVHNLDHKLIRWPGHAAQMQFVLALGLGDRQTIDVKTHLTYRDVLLRRMRQRLGREQKDVLLLRVLVRGVRAGQKRTRVYEMVEFYDEATTTTAMKRCTAIPTSTLAVMLASGAIPGGGAAPPEHVVPKEAYIDAVKARGLRLVEHECDGYRDVTDAALCT